MQVVKVMQEPLQLTERELAALLALKRLSEGGIAFLNVLDADLLVQKGFADLFGKGQFVLTTKGDAYIKKQGL